MSATFLALLLAAHSAPPQGDTPTGAAALLPGSSPENPEVVEGPVAERTDALFTRLAGLGFAGVCGVVVDGEVVLARGYGLADREAGRPVDVDTVFSVGSITKQFTAAAILKLEAQERLSVEDPLALHLAGVPPDKEAITLHHLLTHTAGFPGALGDDWDLGATDEWLVRTALEMELDAEPGTRFEYSNVGYSLLGIVVERVSETPYERFLREQLFEPAGMLDTGYLLPLFEKERLAIGYANGERWGTVLERPMLDDGPCWNLRANGGIHSTVGDMLRWDRALAGDDVLPAAARAKLFEPYVDEGYGDSFYGYGWAVFTTPWDTRLAAHNGGNGILFADFHRYLDDRVTFFLATSVAQEFGPGLSERVRDAVFDRLEELPPATLSRDEVDLARLAGIYRAGPGASLTVVDGGDRLLLRAEGEEAARLLDPSSASNSLCARTEEIVAALLEGNFEPFLDHHDGPRPREAKEEELAALLDELVEELGAPLGLEAATARRTGERLRTAVEARFEAGRQTFVFAWGGGALQGFRIADEPPWRGAAELAVFPVERDGTAGLVFRAWTLGDGPGRAVRFELDEEGRVRGLVLDVGGDSIRAERE